MKCNLSQRGDHRGRARQTSPIPAVQKRWQVCVCVCLTPVFMSTQDKLPVLDVFCGIVLDVCPINVHEGLQYCESVCCHAHFRH